MLGVTSFGSGNIILGGDGSDIIEGRGGDDLIDGDRWLNVRISVRENRTHRRQRSPPSTAWTADRRSCSTATYNPGQLQIVREIVSRRGPRLRHGRVLRHAGELHHRHR